MKRLFTTLIALSILWQVSGYPVKGTVRSGGERLSGVVVTDGYGFAVTDSKGRFKIDVADGAEFVYITTPSGFHAQIADGVPQFYRQLSGDKGEKFDFDLTPAGNPNGYAVFAVADPQTATERHFKRFASETEPDMVLLASEYYKEGIQPVGLYLGDISWDNMDIYGDYRAHMERLGFPVYTVIGNHDFDLNLQGTHEASVAFRRNFGPLWYGFNAGDVHFIMLNNIIYDTAKKYSEGIDDVQLQWVANYLKFLPEGAKVCVAMHAPILNSYGTGIKLNGGEELLSLFRTTGHPVTFLSGHAHLNWNREVVPGVWEHNVGSAGGAWWLGDLGKDGTPNGYRVFEITAGGVADYYKSTGKIRDYQYEIFDRGAFIQKPNAVVVKVWNIDDRWKIEWWQDGQYMGEMERFRSFDPQYCRLVDRYRVESEEGAVNYSLGKYRWPVPTGTYSAAVPSPYAKEVEISITDRQGRVSLEKLTLSAVDVHAHRGGMGLMPENTIEAMLNAVRMGVNTLELDLQLSADGQVVVSHDPYMNYKFVTKPDGSFIDRAETRDYVLYKMTYDSIAGYDTGSKPHPDFPRQANLPTAKPLLSDLIDTVEKFTAENGYTPVNYNIEIKSSEKREREGMVAPYREFADAAMKVMLEKKLGERLIVQCFDVRTLEYLNASYPAVRLAYLLDKGRSDFEANMALLSFVPDWYSPHHTDTDPALIAKCRGAGMKIVPWTVDEPADIERIVGMGVDAIISNYPDRVLKVTRKY